MRSLLLLTLLAWFLNPSVAATTTPVHPFHLEFFAAKKEQNQIVLHWQLANSHLVHHFVLEHSTQGQVWNPIQEVEAREGTIYYRFTDTSATPGKHIYRLKVVEHSGTVIYSPNAQTVLTSSAALKR